MDALPTRLCRSGSNVSATVGQQPPPGSSGGEPRIEERQVVIADLPTRYLTAGAGPTLLLVHGDGESAAGWRCVMPALARTHRVVAPSLPGHGDTAKPDTDYSPLFLAEFVHRFIDTLNLGPTVVLGNSLGGAVAARHALANPDRVPALVLVDSLGLGHEINPVPRFQTLPGVGELSVVLARTRPGAAAYAHVRARFAFADQRRAPRGWLADQRRIARRRGAIAASLAAKRTVIGVRGQHALVLGDLGRLPMPTLIVWGARDRLLPARHAHAGAARLARGQVAIIPDCGHLPHIERPADFVDIVNRFLSQAVEETNHGDIRHGQR